MHREISNLPEMPGVEHTVLLGNILGFKNYCIFWGIHFVYNYAYLLLNKALFF